jgi:predicted component of type VI protein secretion system
MASRVHARIERRRDKFFVIDQSTNGTFVNFAGEGEIVLRREEVMLRGEGRIAFGHTLAESTEETVDFAVR